MPKNLDYLFYYEDKWRKGMFDCRDVKGWESDYFDLYIVYVGDRRVSLTTECFLQFLNQYNEIMGR